MSDNISAGVAPPAPSADREKLSPQAREKLIADAHVESERYKFGLQAICNGARFDPAELKRRAFVDGVEWAADNLVSPAPVDEAKLAEVIWEEQESRVLEGFVIHTPDTARSTARAVIKYLDSLRGDPSGTQPG